MTPRNPLVECRGDHVAERHGLRDEPRVAGRGRTRAAGGAPAGAPPTRALAYPALTGYPRPGDRVLLNTTALDLGLGTGGYALVVAVPDRLPPDPELAGHLVKGPHSPPP